MPRIIKLEPADDGVHKWIAHFEDGKQTKFGAVGYKDYTQYPHDIERRRLYRERHLTDLKTNDPTRAGFLSYYILWGDSTSIKRNLQEYNRRFKKKLTANLDEI